MASVVTTALYVSCINDKQCKDETRVCGYIKSCKDKKRVCGYINDNNIIVLHIG